MARYDRIARLDPPPRSDAFPGWLVLRDLEGREREPELIRRARLRFLAIRCVRRLLARGVDAVDASSLDRQLEGVREEVDRLPEGDRERAVLAYYLGRIATRVPAGLAAGTLGVGATCESAGHGHSAEEFFRTALDLADAHGLEPERIAALGSLGRLYAGRREWREAVAYLESAVEMAGAARDASALGAALRELAVTLVRSGSPAAARTAVNAIVARWEERDGDSIAGIRAAALCALDLADGRVEAAVEAGWRATELLSPADSVYSRTLLDLATACRQLQLRDAAEACLLMVVQVSLSQELAAEARVEHTLTAAEAGDVPAFRQRSESLLNAVHPGDGRTAAAIHLGLGRGAMLIDDLDDARAHLRKALAAAQGAGLGETVAIIADLLTGLERRAETALRAEAPTPSEDVRSLAERIASMGRQRVHSGAGAA